MEEENPCWTPPGLRRCTVPRPSATTCQVTFIFCLITSDRCGARQNREEMQIKGLLKIIVPAYRLYRRKSESKLQDFVADWLSYLRSDPADAI